MTKSELTHIIRQIVSEEIRKELPNAISEVFQQVSLNKRVIREQIVQPNPQPKEDPVVQSDSLFKQSLRELFQGTNVIPPKQTARTPKTFTKNPVLNNILNETRPFSPQERMGAPAGAAAMLAAAQAGVSLPDAMPSQPVMDSMDVPSYERNIPDIGSLTGNPSSAPPITSIVPHVSQEVLLKDDHAPLSNLPDGVSALDVARVSGGDDPVTKALTKNYSGFLKKVEQKADQRKGIR